MPASDAPANATPFPQPTTSAPRAAVDGGSGSSAGNRSNTLTHLHNCDECQRFMDRIFTMMGAKNEAHQHFIDEVKETMRNIFVQLQHLAEAAATNSAAAAPGVEHG
ncbi:hypothetical protein Rhopal_002394-T1 [Rhodotorula paludigena]|uniref:Uncharacterized protein n=1 Tax=Rhodotorula paludigena TaxID=86838 RepID=A0AAV5GHP1_9BASI|nr:hypothetical protein Rhopal_002394-T1 [Rhodotorula paludigena]